MQNFSKFFKVLLSVGVGLLCGSLFVYKLNSLNIQQASKLEPDLKEKLYSVNKANMSAKQKLMSNKNLSASDKNTNKPEYSKTVVVSRPKVVRVIRKEFVNDNYKAVKNGNYLPRHNSLAYYRPTPADVKKIQENVDTYDYLRSKHSPEYYQNQLYGDELVDRGYLSDKELDLVAKQNVLVFYYKKNNSNKQTKSKKNYNNNVVYKPVAKSNPKNDMNVINGDFTLTTNTINKLKSRTVINGDLYVINFNWVKLPSNIKIMGNVYVQNSQGVLFKDNTIIEGNVFVQGSSSLRAMVESVKIKGQVFLG